MLTDVSEMHIASIIRAMSMSVTIYLTTRQYIPEDFKLEFNLFDIKAAVRT
jgi:hypothetical protein